MRFFSAGDGGGAPGWPLSTTRPVACAGTPACGCRMKGMRPLPASLRALLADLIDYAGLYPPAALPLPIVLERYRGFRASPDHWILKRLVLPAAALAETALEPGWRVTLLVDGEPGALPEQVETLETKSGERLSLPTYCEAPLAAIGRDAYAKVRTGGLTPEMIPAPAELAAFLCDAAARRMPFKATAGLHHPIRSERALTYAADSPRATMHGFLNVFCAAAMAWHGAEEAVVAGLLEETDPAALEFSDSGLCWRGRQLTAAQIQSARREFAHGFGSCSFEEPVSELRELGLLA